MTRAADSRMNDRAEMGSNLPSHSRSQAIASAALAGGVAANAMTLVRMFARRKGMIEKTVPQVMEEWLVEKLHLRLPGGYVGHHMLDQLLHVGYGSMLGALCGALFYRTEFFTLRRGLFIGLITWIFGTFILLPLLGAGSPAWRTGLRENAVNLLSHLLFGFWSALVTREVVSQIERGPTGKRDRQATRVG